MNEEDKVQRRPKKVEKWGGGNTRKLLNVEDSERLLSATTSVFHRPQKWLR